MPRDTLIDPGFLPLQITNTDADLRIVATGDLKKGLENATIRLDGDQAHDIDTPLPFEPLAPS